ncbi:MAG: SUMF1/EgtB/PvdO family nonheme iron enzyme [Bryobacteraceae bacterium]
MIVFFVGALLFAGGQPAATADFRSDIAPILEQNCTGCHHSAEGGHIDLTSRDFVLSHKLVLPSQPEASPLYTSIKIGAMPPSGKLSGGDIEAIARWIRGGAVWPAGLALKVSPKADTKPALKLSEIENVGQIRERIAANQTHKAAQSYSVTIPNTTVAYTLVPIAAGHFTMGSTEKPDERPPHQVTVDAFWMQAHEVTWDEYRLFMFANQAGEIAKKDDTVDAVSRPTRPYMEMSFGMGINGFPAISMTQHAANKYAEWLSAKIGEFYRLPTEAEWEYACRAGTTTTYYFGSDASQLKEYAWYSADSGGKYQKVATKKPNAWGLYDMLGNVMEWTLDAYAPYKASPEINPWIKTTAPYPLSVRGGSWNDPVDQLTCGSRVASNPSWKQQDPQLPKSIWYETDAQWLGFRLIRPAKLPAAEEMYKYWNNGVEHDEQ